MHIHRLEKIWLIFGMAMLVVFLAILGVSTFAMGMEPPSHKHSIDPQKVLETPPFDQLGVKSVGDHEYEVTLLAFAFGYEPGVIEVEAGSTVHFTATSTDVVHGFQIPGTNVNMMIVPGEISHISHTFNEPGEYLILCNEYCGAQHEAMKAKIIVH